MNTNQITRPVLHINHFANQQALRLPTKEDRFTAAKAATTALVLIRGLPGSGKSTMASVLVMVGYKHFEADMFFEIDGIYRYDATRIREAHDWCKHMTRDALSRGENVVVSNTFTRVNEMAPYLEMGAGKIRVIEAKGTWENSHGVPRQMVDRMAARWELFPTAASI
ncbi:AAA family ATPase [Rhodoferax ferrireducens]|uniref:AAA family ATPase n=1 Tax=Rhodoferax ferrireducens TaxID=192843 RepID=UPI000E0CDE52|nr:AAA family ATPase [Rhodoferax ferrireducens]